MALVSFDNGYLLNFLCPTQAATQNLCARDDVCDSVFEALTENIAKCRYFDVNFQIFKSKDDNNLILLQVNVQSLNKKFDFLYNFIASQKFIPHVICISETRINKQPLINVNLLNYSFLHVDSETTAGGVAMYVHESIKFQLATNQCVLETSESLWINLNGYSRISFTVGVVYRHPSTTTANCFIENLSDCLADLNNHKNIFYILGDIHQCSRY